MRRQLVRPARPHPRQPEAARRGGPPVADPARGRRLAEPGRRRRCGSTARSTHAHPECGNGVTWSLELRRGATRQRLAGGRGAGRRRRSTVGPIEGRRRCGPATWSRSLIGPRDGNHSCDLTAVDLTSPTPAAGRDWDLAADVSPRRPGRQPARRPPRQPGRLALLHRARRRAASRRRSIPAGSLLARWQPATAAEQKRQLAERGPGAADRRPARGEGRPRRDALSPARLARRPARSGALAATIAAKRPSRRRRRPRDWGLDPAHVRQASRTATAIDADEPLRAGPVGHRGPPARRPGRGLRVRRDRRARRRAGAEGSVQLAVLGRRSPARRREPAARRCPVVVADGGARAAAVRGGVRRVPPAVPAGPLLHQDRAGRRGRHADAVLPRGRASSAG